jgi:ABC-type amino acid transport substrate-binding protein
MFASLIMISGFTAAIATALTVNRLETNIRSVNDLAGLRVGVVSNSSASDTLRRERLGFRRSYDDVRDALAALEAEQLDAVVHDQPLLQYLISQGVTEKIDVLPGTFERQDYGLGLIENSPLREDINRELLAITGSDEWQLIRRDYLGDTID